MEHIRDLIWSGLVAGDKMRKEEIDFDEWTVGEWIDEMEEAEFNKIIDAFNNSMPEKGEEKPGK
jgi:subtilisin-like proprotein convertase family protein